jgi:hypothetical protein
VINGRAYHPQTQGSVEKANDIFKQRLYACQAEYNTTEWVRFLPEIARVVNSTRPSSLPARMTPYEVFFGRKPHWLTEPFLNVDNRRVDENGVLLLRQEADNREDGSDEGSNSDNEYPETDTKAEGYILTELERQIKQSNARTAARMVKKVGGKLRVYTKNAIVSLAIPAKLRLKTEAKRLLYWITKVVRNRYTLICSVSPLSGSHTASQLNEVVAPDESCVPMGFPDWKHTKLTLTKAVQLVNNRGTVAAAQKANRLANKPTDLSGNDEASSEETSSYEAGSDGVDSNEPVRQQPARKRKQVAQSEAQEQMQQHRGRPKRQKRTA